MDLKVIDKYYLSLGRTSQVHAVEVNGELKVRKRYLLSSPEDYQKRYKKIANDPFLNPTITLYERRSAFYKETKVLNLSNHLRQDENFSPSLLAVDEKSLSFVMELINNGETYRDYFSQGNSIKDKTGELVNSLVSLHSIFGRNAEHLYRNVLVSKRQEPAMQPFSQKAEYERWLRYFKTIIRRVSPDFESYLKEHEKNFLQKDKRKGMKKIMSKFLREKGIHLDEAVQEFIQRDWQISYDNDDYAKKNDLISPSSSLDSQVKKLSEIYERGFVTIIHGDFGPQNVFRVEKGVKVCDFTEMRVDRRTIDLVGAVYNIYNIPHNKEQEVASIELIRKYIDGVKEKENIQLDPRLFTVQSLESRLKYLGIGLFAIDCKYVAHEIRMFAKKWPTFSQMADDDEVLQKEFLGKMFVDRFQDFADYILSGEGTRLITDLPRAKELCKQVELVEDIFHRAGVIKKNPAEVKRKERFDSAVGVDK